MGTLGSVLATQALIGLDTSVFIYHLEANPRYLPLTREILYSVQAGRPLAVISVLTVMELTVRPYRLQQPAVAARYEALLSHFPHLAIVDVDLPVARYAAQLRAVYGLRPLDALLVATALQSGVGAWITNDYEHEKLRSLVKVIILDEVQ